jgi:hypothetical protein|tara:strand:- start:4374 stop:5015 length:642 start_codon:yes stop_codon:yes gene_type:complete
MIVHNMEQRSDEWYAVRSGKFTASNFKQLITPKGSISIAGAKTFAYSVAAERYASGPVNEFIGNEWTRRGTELEEDAKSLYTLTTNEPIVSVGFIECDDLPAGCSPDGMVGDDGMVEYKCLKSENHIKALIHIVKENTCPPDYHSQVQGNLWITGRQWIDLVFYHPELPFHVMRVYPDLEIHKMLAAALRSADEVCCEAVSILTQFPIPKENK